MFPFNDPQRDAPHPVHLHTGRVSSSCDIATWLLMIWVLLKQNKTSKRLPLFCMPCCCLWVFDVCVCVRLLVCSACVPIITITLLLSLLQHLRPVSFNVVYYVCEVVRCYLTRCGVICIARSKQIQLVRLIGR